ncbi:hypothetical protein LZ480_02030 [Solibacillus sp. MA9]|uniref:Potassium channel domain-containing protein n=1 Tax=Solibacillus palustris TaxID=2908203 RepID=A0ABS9U8U3_9BACL|nr:hypothetical protein [Solibacillus sp. MA9]MCH7320653.1 hypothetical protein [Solibacillus sp. MA9]
MNESLLVKGWVAGLKLLEKISFFYILRNCIFNNKSDEVNRNFIDFWILLNMFIAFGFIFISDNDNINNIVKYLFVIYGSSRIFEILIYQLNVMLVHPYKGEVYSLNSYRRMTIALIHNFFEIVFWFAGTYLTFQFIQGITPGDAIYHSFTHMVTYSLDIDKGKWSSIALVVLQSQALMGVFMTVISLSRFISLFPQPKSMNELENLDYGTVIEGQELMDIKKELEEIKKMMSDKVNQ